MMHSFRIAGLCASPLVLLIAACGGSDPPLAEQSRAASDPPVAGVTPFIASTTIRGKVLDKITSVNFTIARQAGTVSKPISVTYSSDYLSRHGDLPADHASLKLPVFGLYAGADNNVTITLNFQDDSSLQIPVTVTTAPYTDGIYDSPTLVQARAPGSALGFDFLYMKSNLGSPVIVDTDGRIRWVAGMMPGSLASDFTGTNFIMGSETSPQITTIEFDGTVNSSASLQSTEVLKFHHDIEVGKSAFLNNVDVTINGVEQLESVLQEFTPDGQILAEWDMGKILSDYMTANGDDPTQFVRPGLDWFHMNTAIYDSRDDSVIVSSRENFVIKIGYATGDIRWILGDPTKYWYTFPSLRAKSLAILNGGLVPIGQHSTTITPDGNLMLFNDGMPSLNQPIGTSAGESRTYSAVSSYAIDTTAMTATETWHFDYGQTLMSPFCSSARATSDGSILVDYATAEGDTTARIVGLDPNHLVVFDFRYKNAGCNTAWNSQPIALDALELD